MYLRHTTHSLFFSAIMLGACQVSVLAQAPAAPATYLEMPVHEKLREDRTARRNVQNEVRKVLDGDIDMDEAMKRRFDAWYKLFVFPQITQMHDFSGLFIDSQAEFPKFREIFYRDIERAGKSAPAVHDYLVELTLVNMRAIAQGNYSPAARYNAMLIIGELNSKEPNKIGARTPPEPMLKALEVLLDELKDPKQIDAVRVAALVGVLRHVRTDRLRPEAARRLPDGTKDLIVDRILPLVLAMEAPQGRSASGHAWMRRRGVEILGELGLPGKENSIAIALAGIAGSSEDPLSLRCTAAEALGKIAPPAGQADTAAVAKGLGKLAALSCLQVIERIQKELAEEKKKSVETAPGGPRGIPEGLIPGDIGDLLELGESSSSTLAHRRRLKYQMLCVQGALASVSKWPGADETAAKVSESVVKLIAATDNTELKREEFVNNIRPLMKQIESVVGATVPAPTEGEPVVDPFG